MKSYRTTSNKTRRQISVYCILVIIQIFNIVNNDEVELNILY